MVNPEEQLHKTVWEILGEIKQEQFATPNDEWIVIDTNSGVRERAVRVLAKVGAIKALEYQSLFAPLQAFQKFNGIHTKPNAYKVEPKLPRFEEVYEIYDSTFNHDYEVTELKNLTDEVQKLSQSANQSPEQKENNLSIADRKKLFILEKLKEEWDLTPKNNSDHVTIQTGIGTDLVQAGETTISNQKFLSWISEGGIGDWHELENILNILKQEGLILKFQNLNEAV